jgi:hypothetical protein
VVHETVMSMSIVHQERTKKESLSSSWSMAL